jgi:RING finger protein 121
MRGDQHTTRLTTLLSTFFIFLRLSTSHFCPSTSQFALCAVQSGLVYWKKAHKRSYEAVSLAGLWLVPGALAARMRFWRFLAVWAGWSSVTGAVLHACSGKALSPTTPRRVYAWFLASYKLSVAAGATGYGCLLLGLVTATFGLPTPLGEGGALMVLWYGLYFGVLGRDAAELAADRLASNLGSGVMMAVRARACGVCGGALVDGPGDLKPPPRVVVPQAPPAAPLHLAHPSGLAPPPPPPPTGVMLANGGVGDATIQLACKHCFHGTCLRGWCVVGKKDTCPACREKVDLRAIFAGRPWETRNLQWVQMLDMLRYLVVWNPLILGGLSLGMKFFGVKDHAADRASLRSRLGEVAAAVAAGAPTIAPELVHHVGGGVGGGGEGVAGGGGGGA